MEKETSSINILSMHVHITWQDDQVGYDKYGAKWINKSNPQPEDPRLMDAFLDFHNGVLQELEKFKTNQSQSPRPAQHGNGSLL